MHAVMPGTGMHQVSPSLAAAMYLMCEACDTIQSNANKRARVFLFARIFNVQIEARPVPVNSE